MNEEEECKGGFEALEDNEQIAAGWESHSVSIPAAWEPTLLPFYLHKDPFHTTSQRVEDGLDR